MLFAGQWDDDPKLDHDVNGDGRKDIVIDAERILFNSNEQVSELNKFSRKLLGRLYASLAGVDQAQVPSLLPGC